MEDYKDELPGNVEQVKSNSDEMVKFKQELGALLKKFPAISLRAEINYGEYCGCCCGFHEDSALVMITYAGKETEVLSPLLGYVL